MEEKGPIELLNLENITYRRGRMRILNNLNLILYTGEIHALVYTSPEASRALVGILTGLISPKNYFGSIYWEGKPLFVSSPSIPLNQGVVISRSRPLIIPEATLQENIFLAQDEAGGDAFIDRDQEEHISWEWLKRFSLPFLPSTLAKELDENLYPVLEVIRVLNRGSKLLVFQQNLIDMLSSEDSQILRVILENKVRHGLAVLYLCNNPEFLQQETSRLSVLHRGEVDLKWAFYEDSSGKKMSEESFTYKNIVLPRLKIQEENSAALLSFINWEGEKGPGANEQKLNLHCYEGEALAVGGLYRHNVKGIVEVLGGLTPLYNEKTLLWQGKPLLLRSPADASRNRIAVIYSRSRLIENLSLQDNLFLKIQNSQFSLIWDREFYWKRLRKLCESFNIELPPPENPISNLSALEAKIILLAQFLLMDPLFLVLEDPTLNLNQQDKIIYFDLLGRLTKRGITVLVITSSTWDFSLFSFRKIWNQKEISIEDLLREPICFANKQGTLPYGK